ncbi:uncharacterized protein Dvar_45110 [Desulfosarcina variabilis str. Montpellier]|uniref:hypothetical protein n=1 Tax=Desulfosarcina variabilis TaxID=2300 RepID=UPI003AFAFDCC
MNKQERLKELKANENRNQIQLEVMDELPQTLAFGYLDDPEYFEDGLESLKEMHRLAPGQLRGMTVVQYLLEQFEHDVRLHDPYPHQWDNEDRIENAITYLSIMSKEDSTGDVDDVVINTMRLMINLFNLESYKLMGEAIKNRIAIKLRSPKKIRRNDAIKVVISGILNKKGNMTARQLWRHFKQKSVRHQRTGEDLYLAYYPETNLEIEFDFDHNENTIIERRTDKNGVTTIQDRTFETFRKIVPQAKKMVT